MWDAERKPSRRRGRKINCGSSQREQQRDSAWLCEIFCLCCVFSACLVLLQCLFCCILPFVIFHSESHRAATTSLSRPLATSSPASCTTPSLRSCISVVHPPPALGTTHGRAKGCSCRPAKLWPRDGRRFSSFCARTPSPKSLCHCRCSATELSLSLSAHP